MVKHTSKGHLAVTPMRMVAYEQRQSNLTNRIFYNVSRGSEKLCLSVSRECYEFILDSCSTLPPFHEMRSVQSFSQIIHIY